MVLISFKKLTFLLKAIEDCPEGIPFRQSRIINQFLKLPTTYDEKVSVKIPLEWEKFPETDISLHDDQEKILCHIIDTFTGKLSDLDQVPELHVTSPLQTCPICHGDLDFPKKIKYRRKDPSAMVYCKDGPRIATVYPKKCANCSATIYSSYVEYEQDDGILMRKYFENSEYISATQDTFFECALLEELSEDIFTCNTRFINWSEKYNRLHNDRLKTNVLSTTNLKNKRYELNRQRVLPCWILYSMNKKLNLLFPVQRDESRSLDIELICKIMYPELKKKIDSKWLGHICHQCSSRVVIMDGAAKMYRTRCAAKGECIKNAGHLNEFTSCAASPIQGSNFCEEHKNGKIGNSIERLDLGRITRSKRKELGLEIDLLTTETACRKPSAITVTKDRRKTAGMVYCFRSCGVSLGHLECIHAETNTDFILLLIDIFGERPSPDQLTGVCIDRACDVHPYCQNIGNQGNEVCAFYSSLNWFVDPFHVRQHVEPRCKLNSELCEYHPGLDKHKELLKGENLEIAEQNFVKRNKSNHTTRFLSVYTRLVFLKLLDDELNERIVSSKVLVTSGGDISST